MGRSKKDRELEKYKTDAMIHTRKRLSQRYPQLAKTTSYKDLKRSPGVHLYSTSKRESNKTRIVVAVLIQDEIVYVVKSIAKNMIHTVLTRAIIEQQVSEWNLDIDIDESAIRQAISLKYRTMKTYMEER